MLKKSSIWLISSFGILGAVYGCSSSTTTTPGNNNPEDSGAVSPTNDGSTPDTGGGNGGNDGGKADSGGGGGDSGPTCPAVVAASDIPTYAPTTATPGACTATQISDFITACASQTATQATCNAFFNATANATCGNCISPVDGQGNPITGGPVLVNPTSGDPLTNTPGCVAMKDPTNGTACAAPLANYIQCEDVACGQCTSQSTFNGCQQTTSTGSGGCATYYSSFSTACASDVADGGIASPNGECQDLSFVATLYCGGGDGGVADGG